MAELCQEFGISRVCSYKWYGRFLKGGFVGLVEHSRQARAGSACGDDGGNGCGRPDGGSRTGVRPSCARCCGKLTGKPLAVGANGGPITRCGRTDAARNPELRLSEDLELDSLEMIEITLLLENALILSLANHPPEACRTLGDFRQWMENSSPALKQIARPATGNRPAHPAEDVIFGEYTPLGRRD